MRHHAVAASIACLAALSVSCAKEVSFARGDAWHYETYAPRVDADILVVIDKLDLRRKVRIDYVGRHEVLAGDMLQQIASYELGKMFAGYRESDGELEPVPGRRSLSLRLSVPSYRFVDTAAEVTVRAQAHGFGSVASFDKEYTKRGSKMGHQVWSGSAAVRNSSLAAYQAAFDDLRRDLLEAYGEPPAALPLE